jgi:hypothetical protein
LVGGPLQKIFWGRGPEKFFVCGLPTNAICPDRPLAGVSGEGGMGSIDRNHAQGMKQAKALQKEIKACPAAESKNFPPHPQPLPPPEKIFSSVNAEPNKLSELCPVFKNVACLQGFKTQGTDTQA